MYQPGSGGSWLELTSGPQARISLDVTIIPEPAPTALALIIGLALSLALRRKR